MSTIRSRPSPTHRHAVSSGFAWPARMPGPIRDNNETDPEYVAMRYLVANILECATDHAPVPSSTMVNRPNETATHLRRISCCADYLSRMVESTAKLERKLPAVDQFPDE